jgi:hypothetical protein
MSVYNVGNHNTHYVSNNALFDNNKQNVETPEQQFPRTKSKGIEEYPFPICCKRLALTRTIMNITSILVIGAILDQTAYQPHTIDRSEH